MGSRAQELFSEALELPADRRAEFLDAVAPLNSTLRMRIESLLTASNEVGGFLGGDEVEMSEGAGTWIGPYRLAERLGEGGFGVVYRAEQETPLRRVVALKIVKLGMDTRAVVARFEAERQALALMEHPNIARVFDGGATSAGRPYFVMELVAGTPLIAFCRAQRLTLPQRLEIFLQVCRAVHHAHQKGIIHRDLKPSNVLVTLAEGRPVAKVIDFGIAKAVHAPLTGHTQLSRPYLFVGTPAYMSPEQIRRGGTDIDTRSDIYSLGALLYELLTDLTPLDPPAAGGMGFIEFERRICEHDAIPPAQRVQALEPAARQVVANGRRLETGRLLAELRGDLGQVVLKCLEKDRTRRYETTEDLARDLERYLHDEPVLARPATLAYRARKFVQRHRRPVLGVLAGVLLLGALTIYYTHRLATERDRAQLAAKRAEGISALLMMQLETTDPYYSRLTDGQAEMLARVRQDFVDEPALRLEILATVGRALLRRGQSVQAGVVLREALQAGGDVGRPTAALGQVLNDLGVLSRERADFPAARRFLLRAVEVRRQVVAEDSLNDLAASLVELGRTHLAMEQLEPAAKLFRESLRLRHQAYGAQHREVATSLSDLASVESQLGHLETAEKLCRDALEMYRHTVGAEHPNYAGSLASLAGVRLDRGDAAGAETMMREAVEISRRTLGPKHWRTARAMGQLAVTWRALGRNAEAEQQLREALAIMRENSGGAPVIIAWLEAEVGRMLLLRGEFSGAEVLFRSALERQRGRYPDEGWHIAATKSLLGGALLRQGRLQEAEPLLLAASEALPDVPGPQGQETKANAERLAELRQIVGRNR